MSNRTIWIMAAVVLLIILLATLSPALFRSQDGDPPQALQD